MNNIRNRFHTHTHQRIANVSTSTTSELCRNFQCGSGHGGCVIVTENFISSLSVTTETATINELASNNIREIRHRHKYKYRPLSRTDIPVTVDYSLQSCPSGHSNCQVTIITNWATKSVTLDDLTESTTGLSSLVNIRKRIESHTHSVIWVNAHLNSFNGCRFTTETCPDGHSNCIITGHETITCYRVVRDDGYAT